MLVGTIWYELAAVIEYSTRMFLRHRSSKYRRALSHGDGKTNGRRLENNNVQ